MCKKFMRIKKKENIDIDADFPRVIHNSCTNQVNYYDNGYSHISFPCLKCELHEKQWSGERIVVKTFRFVSHALKGGPSE